MKQKGSDKMPVSIKWFPPSWFQIKTKDKIIYIDPAWMRTYFTKYPKKIEFSTWPDPIDGLPEKDLNFKADPQEFKDKVEARSDIMVVPLKIGEVYHLKC